MVQLIDHPFHVAYTNKDQNKAATFLVAAYEEYLKRRNID